MSTFQNQKQVVLQFYAALDTAAPERIEQVITDHVAPGYIWRGYHPFGLLDTPASVAARFWVPLRNALSRIQRRMDIFMAGDNFIDDGKTVWVASMGHLMGLFDRPWLGIQPTGRMVMLRYAEFHRIEDGKIAETTLYFDIPHLMAQAGLSPLPQQTAQHFIQPGPMTHDGVMLEPQDPALGTATMAAMNAMISDLGQWKGGLPLEEELARTWVDDMIWWGPEGIGATYTIPRYAAQHSGPFRAAFSDRSGTGHIARIAEGQFSGFFGWPNFTARLTGPFMGREPTGKLSEFRVIDMYRSKDGKLVENWVFIDLLHFWRLNGWDVLAELGLGED